MGDMPLRGQTPRASRIRPQAESTFVKYVHRKAGYYLIQTHRHREEVERDVVADYRDFGAELLVGDVIEVFSDGADGGVEHALTGLSDGEGQEMGGKT